MKKNIGTTDKIIRIIIAIIALILIVCGVVKGMLAIITGIVGIAMLLTALFSFCGLYTLIGITTCKK